MTFILHYSIPPLHAGDLLYTLDVEYFLGEVIKQRDIAHVDRQHTLKQAALGLDVDAAQQAVVGLVDDRSDGSHDADVVAPQDLERGGKLAARLSRPAGAYDAIGITLLEVEQVLAIGAVNLDGAVAGDKALNAVAVDGVAALG